MRYYDGSGPEPERAPEEYRRNPEEQSSVDFGVETDIRILEQGRYAITKPSRLLGLGCLPKKKFAGYTFMLLFLVSLIVYVIPMVASILGFGGFRKLLNEKLPDISVENGVLTAENRFEMAMPNMHIILDTDEEAASLPDTDVGGLYLLVGSESFRLTLLEVAGSQRVSQVLMTGSISDFFPDGTKKEDLTAMIPAIYISMVLAMVAVIAGLVIRYFFMALVYMIFTVPLVRRNGLPLTGGEIFRMCFYAETAGILLVNINSATGFLPGSIVSLAGMIITCVYIFRSVRSFTHPEEEQ